MAEVEIVRFHGQELWLHNAKLLWLPSAKLLCMADIHLEKGSFFSKFGTLLPPYDAQETLQQIERWIDHFRPEIFIALGDSFHDTKAGSRLKPENHRMLLSLISRTRKWLWITGNHDASIDSSISGERRGEYEYEGICFRHEFDTDTRAQITGHFHPKASIKIKRQNISSPCFLLEDKKLILPSFGTFTGGLDVDSPVLKSLMPPTSRTIYLAHASGIYTL